MTDIESPCNKVCAVDPTRELCVGCGRTLAEIGSWIAFSADERTRIMTELPGRLAALARAHVPEKWEPVFRQGHASANESGAYPDSAGCAPGERVEAN
jgi:uncharacterized protein